MRLQKLNVSFQDVDRRNIAKRMRKRNIKRYSKKVIELDFQDTSDIVFIQSYKSWQSIAIAAGINMSLTGKIDAPNGMIATDPVKHNWLKIHSAEIILDEKVFTGINEMFGMDNFTATSVFSQYNPLSILLQDKKYKQYVSELLKYVTDGNITGLQLEEASLQAIIGKDLVPFYFLSQGQVETIKLAVNLCNWCVGKTPFLLIALPFYQNITYAIKKRIFEKVIALKDNKQALIFGHPLDMLQLFLDIEIDIYELDDNIEGKHKYNMSDYSS